MCHVLAALVGFGGFMKLTQELGPADWSDECSTGLIGGLMLYIAAQSVTPEQGKGENRVP